MHLTGGPQSARDENEGASKTTVYRLPRFRLDWGRKAGCEEWRQRGKARVCISKNPSKPMRGQCFTWRNTQSYSAWLGSRNLPIIKNLKFLLGGSHGHYLGLLRQSFLVAPSKGTRLANVWRPDMHWRRLLRLVLERLNCGVVIF
jgi:hypothetical protein